MASIVNRKGRYCVVYNYINQKGQRKQKWETYKTLAEAKARQKVVEYKTEIGSFMVPQCKTVNELMAEYVELYGKNKWAMSTYSGNVALIEHYVKPMIGSMKLEEVTPRVLEKYYQKLLTMKAVQKKNTKKNQNISAGTVREIHKLLRSCFGQAVKWELLEKNPVALAEVPKVKRKKREIWTAETLFHAIEVCEDPRLRLALHLTFACSLRIGELLGLTWDCVDISEKAMETGSASITVNKELQRVNLKAMKAVNDTEIVVYFPKKTALATTQLVLKSPKTQSSIRKIFLPRSVAEMLLSWKEGQDYTKSILREDYKDYNLVLASETGLPADPSSITDSFRRLIKEHDLPQVVFHSLRHSSITYKLKLNGGDVKAVQGDSGHAQASMVTEVYSHILDDDRKNNARLFEEAFYSGKGRKASKGTAGEGLAGESPDFADMAALIRLLEKPETAALLKAVAATLGK